MKKPNIILALLTFLALPVMAGGNITFSWTNSPAEQINWAGVNIYGSTNADLSAPIMGVVTNVAPQTATLNFPAGNYVFWATSFDALGNESDRSNYATNNVLVPPTGFHTVTRTNGVTTSVTVKVIINNK